MSLDGNGEGKRSARIDRRTAETEVSVELCLDGSGKCEISTGIGFFDHMLSQVARHGMFDLKISAKGDLQVDEHHTVEDVGIALGRAFDSALGERRGIGRYGFFILPMDEALGTAAIDFAGRFCYVQNAEFAREKVGEFPTELAYDFFFAFAQNAKCALNLKVDGGRNDHHKLEAMFKSFARACRIAT